MRRTSLPVLAGAVVVGAIVGWLTQLALAAAGSASFTPTVTLYSALFGIAAIVLVLGRPVRRSVRGTRTRPLDPFYAMRVLVLAKAATLTGALATGVAVALVLYAVTRPGLPVAPGFVADLVMLTGGLALVIAGLIVETWCRIPPEDREELPSAAVERR